MVSTKERVSTPYHGLLIPRESFDNEQIRMTNQIWKLIPMREHDEDWRIQLVSLLEELAGLGKIGQYYEDPNFLILLSKLEGLNTEYCEDFMIYRKTIFKCIDLLGKVIENDKS